MRACQRTGAGFTRNLAWISRTSFLPLQVKYNVGLADEAFTQRSLRRPPAQWISGD